MTKEFCTYEQALALKELGFDEECLGLYRNGSLELKKNTGGYYDNKWINHFNEPKICTAPLYQQAFRFFREKHNIHAEITWSPSYEYDPGEWSDAIYEITFVDVSYTKEWKAESPDMQRSNGKQLTYEGAQLECLNMLIETVKNKING